MEKKRLQTDTEQGKQQTSGKKVDKASGQQGAINSEEEEQKFKLGNKKQVLNILRENETYKAMKRRTRKNLFDPHYTYKLSEEGFDRDTSKWATSMSLRTSRMLSIGRYVVKFAGLAKGETMTLEESRMEMWRKMVIGSQKEKPGATEDVHLRESTRCNVCRTQDR